MIRCYTSQEGIANIFIKKTPASKALQPLVIDEPEPFLDVHIGFWRFRQQKQGENLWFL